MHAYLVVGKNPNNIKKEIVRLAREMGAKMAPWQIKSIADIRELNKFVRLSFAEPTAIVINNFDLVTEEASNAFLKNLEEPGDNVKFILSASNIHRLLPTIVSRCVVVNVGDGIKANTNSRQSAIEFMDSSVGEKFEMIDGIRQRDEAIEFVTKLIEGLHAKLVSGEDNSQVAVFLESATNTLGALQNNGNVNLQLTNFIVSIDYTED